MVPHKKPKKFNRRSPSAKGLRCGNWNCNHLSRVLYDYLKAAQFDILALTELWGDQTIWEGPNFISSEPTPKSDPAAGVGIMLSPQMAAKVKAKGTEGSSRVVWARIELSMFDLFVVAAEFVWRDGG